MHMHIDQPGRHITSARIHRLISAFRLVGDRRNLPITNQQIPLTLRLRSGIQNRAVLNKQTRHMFYVCVTR